LGDESQRRDLASGVQAAIARQLAERTERAMTQYGQGLAPDDRRFVVAGGVAANSVVRAALQAACAKHGFSFAAPPLRYCTDNAAMIALAGAERLRLGLVDGLDFAARPRWPLDAAAALDQPIHKFSRKGAKA
jgi:N6-L-threonylcarbamoyladenine synthase